MQSFGFEHTEHLLCSCQLNLKVAAKDVLHQENQTIADNMRFRYPKTDKEKLSQLF
jgi:hypothetical protein